MVVSIVAVCRVKVQAGLVSLKEQSQKISHSLWCYMPRRGPMQRTVEMRSCCSGVKRPENSKEESAVELVLIGIPPMQGLSGAQSGLYV